MNDEDLGDHRRVTLPTGLSMRVDAVVSDESLGYRDSEEFIFAAIRRELDLAERKRFLLRREGPR